jgi:hypothetical protein
MLMDVFTDVAHSFSAEYSGVTGALPFSSGKSHPHIEAGNIRKSK